MDRESASHFETYCQHLGFSVLLIVTSLDVTYCTFANAYKTKKSYQDGDSPPTATLHRCALVVGPSVGITQDPILVKKKHQNMWRNSVFYLRHFFPTVRMQIELKKEVIHQENERCRVSKQTQFRSRGLLVTISPPNQQQQQQQQHCTIFVNLGLFRHFETVTNIRTWRKSHRYWRML